MLGGAVFFSPSGTMHYQVQIYSLKFTDIQLDTSIHRFGALTYKCNQKVCNFVYKSKKPYPTWIWAPLQGQLDLLECFQHSHYFKKEKSLPGAALFITRVLAESSRPQMPRVNNFPLKLTRMWHKGSSLVMRAGLQTTTQNTRMHFSVEVPEGAASSHEHNHEHGCLFLNFPGGVDCDFVTQGRTVML